MYVNIIDLYGVESFGSSPWDSCTTEPGLTHQGNDGDHTVSQDYGFNGRWVAVENDSGSRVYVYGHNDSDALDIALETPVALPHNLVKDNLEGELAAPAPHYLFGWRYTVDEEDSDPAKQDEYHWSDGEVYDLGTGYGPNWSDKPPPVEALGRLICSYLANATEVEVEDEPDGSGTRVSINGLAFVAPRLVLGEFTTRTVRAMVAWLTRDDYEYDSGVNDPFTNNTRNPPVERIFFTVHNGFWCWFAKALLAYGYYHFVVRSNRDESITFYSDGLTCSGPVTS
jgi:hypothetical protein